MFRQMFGEVSKMEGERNGQIISVKRAKRRLPRSCCESIHFRSNVTKWCPTKDAFLPWTTIGDEAQLILFQHRNGVALRVIDLKCWQMNWQFACNERCLCVSLTNSGEPWMLYTFFIIALHIILYQVILALYQNE